MGMFDSFYDDKGEEWQTKAFDCRLDVFRVDDRVPDVGVQDFQVEIYHYRPAADGWTETFATIHSGRVVEVDAARDRSLPLLDSYGGWRDSGAGR